MLVVNSKHAPTYYIHPEYRCLSHVFDNDGLRISLSKGTQTETIPAASKNLVFNVSP